VLYVNSSNAPGAWAVVDNSTPFAAVAATQSGQVFALDTAGGMHLETLLPASWGRYVYWFWSGQDISAGMRFYGEGGYGLPFIYADTDASGQAEVYALSGSNQDLFRWDQGSWQQMDWNVWDFAPADGGYFFDTNPTAYGTYGPTAFYAWAYDPNAAGNPWIGLGGGVQ
jgi:hypothetical protein